MKMQLLSSVMLCTLGLVGCGDDNTGPTNPDNGPRYNTADNISTYLEGKTLVMSGANIPSHPNGYDEDVNYGEGTQCYKSVTMTVAAGHYTVTRVLGTLRYAPTGGSRGECDHENSTSQLQFTSTAVLIENVAEDGSCFDVTYTYPSFKQEGRAQVSQDGKTLKLELYREGQASGHRCANGSVGAQTVILDKQPFTGNAVQTYTIQ